jgi:hypothetical protein
VLFAELGVAELDAGGLQGIDELEQLGKPAAELHTCLSALAIVLGHGAERIEVFGRWDDILRPPLSSIREDGACVQGAAGAMARGLTALAAQGVNRAGQQGGALEASLEQAGQELLDLVELPTERTQAVVHRRSPGAVPLCRSRSQSCYRNPAGVAKNRKKGKNAQTG